MTNQLRILALALAALASACQASGGFDTSFSAATLDDAHYAAAQAAAEEWCVATDGECCPTVSRNEGTQSITLVDELRHPNGEPYPVEMKAITVRSYSKFTQPITISNYGSIDTSRRLMRHEFCHACLAQAYPDLIRQGHLPAGNVMAPDEAMQPENITPEDVAYSNGTLRGE